MEHKILLETANGSIEFTKHNKEAAIAYAMLEVFNLALKYQIHGLNLKVVESAKKGKFWIYADHDRVATIWPTY